jgi:GT2 family glycosyltransferase
VLPVTVVVVPREGYSSAAATLRAVFDTVPPETRIVVVRGGMPRRVLRAVRSAGGERIAVIGPNRHLSPGAAHRLGLDATDTPFVAFIDNDAVPDPGWLEAMVDAAVEHDAWVVDPLVTQESAGGVVVHSVGGDCRLVEQSDGRRGFVTSHRLVGQPVESVERPEVIRTELFEYHCVLIHADRFRSIGGPDQRMSAQGEHVDVSLRVQAAGGTIWCATGARVHYRLPARIALSDLPFFLGRWSPRWVASSRAAFGEAHGVDPDANPSTWSYPAVHRARAWRSIAAPVTAISRIIARRGSVEAVSRAFDRVLGARIADLALVVAPRWRGGGTSSDSAVASSGGAQ